MGGQTSKRGIRCGNTLWLTAFILLLLMGGFLRFYKLPSQGLMQPDVAHYLFAGNTICRIYKLTYYSLSGSKASNQDPEKIESPYPVERPWSAKPLWYLLSSLGVWLWGVRPLTLQIISALAGVVSIIVAFLIGYRLWGGWGGVVCAAGIAFSGTNVSFSREGFSHALSWLFILSAFYFFIVYDDGWVGPLLCGLFAGLAFCTHPVVVINVALFGVGYLVFPLNRGGRVKTTVFWGLGFVGVIILLEVYSSLISRFYHHFMVFTSQSFVSQLGHLSKSSVKHLTVPSATVRHFNKFSQVFSKLAGFLAFRAPSLADIYANVLSIWTHEGSLWVLVFLLGLVSMLRDFERKNSLIAAFILLQFVLPVCFFTSFSFYAQRYRYAAAVSVFIPIALYKGLKLLVSAKSPVKSCIIGILVLLLGLHLYNLFGLTSCTSGFQRAADLLHNQGLSEICAKAKEWSKAWRLYGIKSVSDCSKNVELPRVVYERFEHHINCPDRKVFVPHEKPDKVIEIENVKNDPALLLLSGFVPFLGKLREKFLRIEAQHRFIVCLGKGNLS